MKSKIYEGFVAHTRYRPVHHRFRYPIYFYGVYLDELAMLDRRLPFFGYNRLRPASIYDADYLDDRPGSIQDKLLGFLPEEMRPRLASVLLVTQARYFNYVFNPVSFYFCRDRANRLIAAIAEVNNTFGERHVYLLPDGDTGHDRFTAKKVFHVSPFNDMNGTYRFILEQSGNDLDVRVRLFRDREMAFEARLRGAGRDLTARSHVETILRHPVLPHLTMPRIILEAMRLLYRRRLAWHDKPPPSNPFTIRHGKG